MRVTVVVSSISRRAGGLFESVRRLSQVVYQSGHPHVVLSMRDRFTENDRDSWSPLQPRTSRIVGPYAFGCSPGLKRRIFESNPNIVHQHGIWMFPSIACLQWARQSRQPYVVSSHGMLDPWALRHSRFKKALASFVYQRQHLESAACIRALNEEEAIAVRRLGIDRPICVIPNGIEMPVDGDSSSAPAWAGSLPPESKVLLYLGRLHPKKNLLNLIAAWRSATRREANRKNWHLVIAGWDQSGYEKHLMDAAGLAEDSRIVFAGPQFDQEKLATFRRANAFVLPSLSEGLPMTVLEAWSYSLPVVMTDYCNLPVGFRRDAAIRVDADVETISAGLTRLFEMNDADRVAMGARGAALARESFSWRSVGSQMIEVYRWVLCGTPKPSSIFD